VIVAIACGQLASGPANHLRQGYGGQEAGHYVLSAQQLAPSVPIWSGSVRCEIDIKGPGYVNHQTHTWTLTGARAPDGSPLDYPGTWSVTGAGSLQASATQTAATWKIQGSAPGVRMAIFVRQSDQRLLVLLRHGQLNAPEATMLVRQESRSLTTAQLRKEQRPTPAAEWRPFPTIVDVPTSTHITGSSTTLITERVDAMQPAGSQGQAACTWDLVQGPGGSGSGAAPASGAASGASASTAGGAASGAKVVTGGAAPGGAATGTIGGGAAPGRATRAGGAAPAGGAAGAASGAAGAGTTSTGIAATGGGAAAGAAAGGGAAGAGAGTSSPTTPGAAGCDADIVTLACTLPAMRNGLSITHDANFHVATDTSDWFTVTATMNASEAPFAVLDFSLTGGTADGSYAIEVSEGAPGSLKSVGNSGAAHAPRTTVAWAAAGSKTLFIQARHIAGPPANTLYSLRLSMSGSQTAPLTLIPLSPDVISAIVPSPSGQTGTIGPIRRTPDAKAPSSSAGTTSTTIPQDGMPNACATAGAKVVNVTPGLFMIVTGGIEASGVEDWLTVHFTSASVHVTLGSAVPIPGGSDFQIATYASCSSPLTSPTTGAGIKAVDLPGSGPHDVIVRITASPWSATGATYSLRLEGK
jgi:hypothetical protein